MEGVNMQYRNLGKTGLKVSEIGLGCENIDKKPFETVDSVVNKAIDLGVNIFDIFMPGEEVRSNIAKAMGTRRKDVYIQGHIGSTDVNMQYDISRDEASYKKYFERLLELFGYVDLGMLFFIDSEEDFNKIFNGGIADYALKLKEKGDIRHIGFSSHNPEMAKKAIETGLPEMMMFSINPAFDMTPSETSVFDVLEKPGFDNFHGVDPVRASLYKLAESKGVGITVMKTFGAGKLLSAEHTPFSQPMTPWQCIHYALTRPAVSSTLIGSKTPEEVEDLLKYYSLTDEDRDYTSVMSSVKNDFKGSCVYCNHCLPCPSEINIGTVNKYLDIARLDEGNIPPSIRSHYSVLEHTAGECIQCGSCESRCPFGVDIIGNMEKASQLFGK